MRCQRRDERPERPSIVHCKTIICKSSHGRRMRLFLCLDAASIQIFARRRHWSGGRRRLIVAALLVHLPTSIDGGGEVWRLQSSKRDPFRCQSTFQGAPDLLSSTRIEEMCRPCREIATCQLCIKHFELRNLVDTSLTANI